MQRNEIAMRMILANHGSREAYEERAAIVEYDAGHPRLEAERLALEMMLVEGRRKWS